MHPILPKKQILLPTVIKTVDDIYNAEINQLQKRLNEIEAEKKQSQEKFDLYYATYSKKISDAYNSGEKKCTLKFVSDNTIWNSHTQIKINKILELALENIKDNLISSGYVAILEPKYEYSPNDNDCRGCGDYDGYMVLNVLF